MKHHILCLMMMIMAQLVAAAPGLHTKGRFLYTACDEKIVLIGVNRMFTWADRDGSSIPEIAKTGANTIRIVARPSDSPQDMDRWIQKTIDHQMIPIPELHGATGNLGNMPKMVDWWVRDDVVAMLKKHERYVIVNIANESGDCGVDVNSFVSAYKKAIQRIRNTGLRMPLLIDGPCWAHNTEMLRHAARALHEADPEKNLIFANHYYGKDFFGRTIGLAGEAAYIKKEVEAWVNTGLPFLWGEVGNVGGERCHAIDFKSLMRLSNKNEIGWLAWSWGPGNTPCNDLDMSKNETFGGLHDWGLQIAVTDENSISNTSRRPLSLKNKGTCGVSRQLPTRPIKVKIEKSYSGS